MSWNTPNVVSGAEQNEMYPHLQMADEQIRKYEMGMKSFEQSIVKDPNGQMRGTVSDEEIGQFKRVLSEKQFKKYEKWRKGQN
jgi:hypothetical protein